MTEKLVSLLEAVEAILNSPGPGEMFALQAAYNDFQGDPILESYAAGEYESVEVRIPSGCQITVSAPRPVHAETEEEFLWLPVKSEPSIDFSEIGQLPIWWDLA